MINGYDRLRGKQALKNKREVPYNDPKKHFRGNIDRVVAICKEENEQEAGKRFVANTQEVLNHK